VVEDRADTWGHGVDRWDNELGHAEMIRTKLLEDGPVFRRHRRWFIWGTSSGILDVVEWYALNAVELVLHITWRDRYQALKLELPMPVPKPRLHVRTPAAVVDRPLDGDEWFWGDWLGLDVGDQRLMVLSDGVSAYDATPERLRLTLLRCVPHAQHKPVPHPEDSPAPFLDEGHQRARFWLAAPGAAASETDLDRLAAGLLTPAEQMLDSAHPSSRVTDVMKEEP
jgi:alpha-mannosidase